MDLKQYIRDVPDFPSPGILFRDITPIISTPSAMRYVVDTFAGRYQNSKPDYIVAIEARGFLFGAPLAYHMGVGLVPVRKQGKLPLRSLAAEYSLEYGTNVVEMHSDAISSGQKVIIVDDLLATGGTLQAAMRLVEQAGATVLGLAVVAELLGLNGRKRLQGHDVYSLIQYEGT